MSWRTARFWRRSVFTLIGVVLGAVLVGGSAYMYNSHIILGAVIGAVLVGVLCDGVAIGTVSTVTLGAVVFALFVFMIGPGYDDYAGHAVIPAAIIGAFVGWQFRRPRRKVGNPRKCKNTQSDDP